MEQLLVYADDVNILGRSVHTVRKNTEALEVAIKATAIEVNACKTARKYMFTSWDQTAGQCHIIKIDNSSFEGGRVEIFGNNLNE